MLQNYIKRWRQNELGDVILKNMSSDVLLAESVRSPRLGFRFEERKIDDFSSVLVLGMLSFRQASFKKLGHLSNYNINLHISKLT